MPELPEVETTRRGIEPLIVGKAVTEVIFRVPKLRWPVPQELSRDLAGQVVHAVERRAKYLLLRFDRGTVLLHLGMTGNLRVVSQNTPLKTHDHVDMAFADGSCLRLNDARRFGAFLWTPTDPHQHPLLVELGPEPFAAEVCGDYFFGRSRGRKVAVKQFIMDQKVIVGVGNIYASEALFRAGIRPDLPAGKVGCERYERLSAAIQKVLQGAIRAGGTTIRDFVTAEGKPGYFSLELKVYGREGQPCPTCGMPVRQKTLGQRSTFYCSRCQR